MKSQTVPATSAGPRGAAWCALRPGRAWGRVADGGPGWAPATVRLTRRHLPGVTRLRPPASSFLKPDSSFTATILWSLNTTF